MSATVFTEARAHWTLFNNPVGSLPTCGWLASLARNPQGFNAPHFAVFKRLLFKN
jgi:hypothetical protein